MDRPANYNKLGEEACNKGTWRELINPRISGESPLRCYFAKPLLLLKARLSKATVNRINAPTTT